MTYAEELGRNLRMARVELGLSLRQVATQMLPPSSESAVSEWERGTREPTLARLRDYCRVVSKRVAVVLPYEGPPTRIQIVVARRLRECRDPNLAPLVSWAAAYDTGTDIIRFTPEAMEVGADLCSLPVDELRARLREIQLCEGTVPRTPGGTTTPRVAPPGPTPP